MKKWADGNPMPLRILIVDDSVYIRHTVRSYLLNNSDWEICGEAADGATAVELVGKLKPDAVVLDFSMPIMNGLDATKRIAGISSKITIILFTVHNSSVLQSQARTVGINSVVSKDEKASLEGRHRALAGDEPLAP